MLPVPAILNVSLVFTTVPVESSPTNVIGELVKYELKLGPVIVNVSPDTAVDIPVAPATLNVSPKDTVVPDESSPTNLRVVIGIEVNQLKLPNPSVFNICPAVPSVLGHQLLSNLIFPVLLGSIKTSPL